MPKQKLGIEYDGAAWHKDFKRDLKKDKICEKHDITLIRIREIGCVEYSSDCIKKYISPYKMQELNEAIRFIFNFINQNYQMNVCVDVDVDRDRMSILENINLSEKEKSIASYCPKIKLYWDYVKNGKITPEMISYGSGKTVFLKCNAGHEWKAVVNDFPKHPWCPYCEGHKVVSGENDLFTTNPDLISLWSPNNTIDPKAIKSGCNSKALWCCPNCGGEYEMVVYDKIIGQGCPYCSGKRVLKGFNDLATLLPELIEEWDYDKNVPLKPYEVTKGSNKKVWWICKKGHKWEATIAKRTSGQSCPICSGHIILPGYNDLATLNPNLAKQWHPTKNNSLQPDMVSLNSHKKVWWICEKGHEWEADIAGRTAGHGCPVCSGRTIVRGYNDLASKYPNVSEQWHPTKNGKLTPQEVSPFSHKKVWWICNMGHEWQARISNRTNGTGCPFCNKTKGEKSYLQIT